MGLKSDPSKVHRAKYQADVQKCLSAESIRRLLDVICFRFWVSPFSPSRG